MKRALIQVASGKSFREVAEASGISKSSLQRAFKRIIPNKSGLSEQAMLRSIEKARALPRLGCPRFVRYLSDDEEAYVSEFVTNMHELGFGLDRGQLRALCTAIAQNTGHEKAECGDQFLAGFINRTGLRLLKSQRLDFRRVEKATKEVRDAMFDVYEGMLNRMVAAGTLTAAQIKDDAFMKRIVFNFDEWSDDAPCGKRRRKVSKRAGALASSDISDGDKSGPFHASVGVLTRANGEMMPPLIIHSGKRNWKSFFVGLPTKSNWMSGVSENGSMTKVLFSKFCKDFTRILPDEFGVGKLPAILVVDGHSSRWTYEGLKHLRDRNVWPFCLASHTTKWSQPNDCGVNASLKAAYAKVLGAWRIVNVGMRVTRFDFNVNITKAFRIFDVTSKKKKGGLTLIERAFKRTGLSPVNRENENWTKAIAQHAPTALALQGKSPPCPPPPREVRSTSRGHDESARLLIYPVRDSRDVVVRAAVAESLTGFLTDISAANKKKNDEKKKKKTTIVSTYNGLDVSGHLESIRQAELDRDERERLKDEGKKKRAAEKKKREAEKKTLAEKKRKRKEKEEKALLREAKKRVKKGARLLKHHHLALLRELGTDVDASKSASEVALVYAHETSARGKRRHRSPNE